MFAKLKADAEKKLAVHKDNQKTQEETKWRGEVLVGQDQRLFKDYEGWEAVYDPQKQGGAGGGGGDDSPGAVQKAVVAKIAENLQQNVMRVIMTVVGKLLGPASAAIQSVQPDLSDVLNAANGAVLSYAFQAKIGGKRQAYFRGLATTRLARALFGAMSKEAAVMGVQLGDSIDAAQVNAVVQGVTAKALGEIEKQKVAAVAAIKASPLFGMTGVDGAQVDAGVVALQGFLQGYLESKVGDMVKTMEVTLATLLTLVAKHKNAIMAQLKAKVDAEPSEDFKKAAADISRVLEESYGTLNGAVGKYVDDVMVMLSGVDYRDAKKAQHVDPSAK